MKKRLTLKSGFTLLEVLIAIGILALGLVTVFALFPVGIYAIKETVDDTRSATLAGTARSQLTGLRANLRILDSGSQFYANGGYVPFGPWRFPGSITVFRAPLYEYVDPGLGFQRMVTFDDRKYVPISLTSTRDGFNGSNTVTVRQADLTRDADRLEYFRNPAAPGPNMYDPYGIVLRVQGSAYLIWDRTYENPATGLAAPLPLGELKTLVLAPGIVPNLPGEVRFEVLLPVAQKEPPMDVPQEWVGGIADFSVAGPTYNIKPLSQNRNLAQYLCWVPGGVPPGGWISVRGDWFQVTDATVSGGMPTDITVDNTQPLPMGGSTEDFKLLLPVVIFDIANIDDNGTPDLSDDTLLLPVLRPLPTEAGGGPQLGFLESGAYIEVLLDGATGTFLTSTPLNWVTNVTGVNTSTQAFITQGNFIRVDGRDYGIDGVLGGGWFPLVGRTVPNLGDKYFNIVLGYRPGLGRVPHPARFPVKSVRRAATTGSPVLEFSIGRDANGDLPTDFPGSIPYYNPVHILPKNNSQFSYEVVLSQKSPAGDFQNINFGVTDVLGPSRLAATPDSPVMPIIPFPPSLDPAAMNSGAAPYSIRLLTEPTSSGLFGGSRPVTSIDPSYTFFQISQDVFPIMPLPFHAFDSNHFVSEMSVGIGRFTVNAVPPIYVVDFLAAGGSITADAVYLAPGVNVDLRDSTGILLAQGSIGPGTSMNDQLSSVEVVGAGIPGGPPPTVNNGDTVYVYITPSDATSGLSQTPRARCKVRQGSDVVEAVYADELNGPLGIPPGPATPTGWKGLPYSDTTPARHQLAVGDYIEGRDASGNVMWYAVKAIQNNDNPADPTHTYDFFLLDRPYEGADDPTAFCRYETPIEEAYTAQVAVFRNYRHAMLRDSLGTKARAAAFGYDSAGNFDAERLKVQLSAPLPANFKPGDYLRADGDANHSSAPSTDLGLGDGIDGDWRWYMIDAIHDNGFVGGPRTEVVLTSPYRGYVPALVLVDPSLPSQVWPWLPWQPASATSGIVRTFDTIMGAF